LPAKWRKYRRDIFDKHPESEYPKLYYQPVEVEYQRIKLRKTIDGGMVILGMCLIIYALANSLVAKQVASLMFICLIIQLFPYVLSQYWGSKNTRLIENKQQKEPKKAMLSARRLTSFISPTKIFLLIATYLGSTIFGLFLYFDPQWQSKAHLWIGLILLNTLTVIYVGWLSYKTLYGKSQDKLLSSPDKLARIERKLKELVHTSILFSLFILSSFIIKVIGLGASSALIMTSVYLQTILYWMVNPVAERDFSVYKANQD